MVPRILGCNCSSRINGRISQVWWWFLVQHVKQQNKQNSDLCYVDFLHCKRILLPVYTKGLVWGSVSKVTYEPLIHGFSVLGWGFLVRWELGGCLFFFFMGKEIVPN